MYHFIINPHSKTGKAMEIWKIVEQALVEKNVIFQSHFTEYAGHAIRLTRELCARNQDKKTIVVVGGDGTVNEVINGLSTYKDITLGYIPTGSGNDLARGLNLSREPLSALNRILSPHRYLYIDYGLLTYYTKGEKMQRKFAVSSGIGYDAEICYRALTSKLKTVLNKLKLGKLTYLLLGLWQIIKNKPANAEIIIDGIFRSKLKNLIFITSMIQQCEGGGLRMAPTAINNDGSLTLCIVSGISKPRMLYMMPFLLLGRHTKMKGIKIINCKSIEIKTTSSLMVHTDGECSGLQNHLYLTCKEKQLKFMA